MVTVTIDDVIGWDPCDRYTAQDIVDLFAGRDSLNAYDIINLKYVPYFDRLWGVLRAPFFTNKGLCLLTHAFAEHVLPIFPNWILQDALVHLDAPQCCIDAANSNPDKCKGWCGVWAAAKAEDVARAANAAAARACAVVEDVAGFAIGGGAFGGAAAGAAEKEWQLKKIIEILEIESGRKL